MTLTHLSQKYTENARNVREYRENGQLVDEKIPTEKMEFLDSDTDREIETDAEDSKIAQKYTVSRMVIYDQGFNGKRRSFESSLTTCSRVTI